MSSNTPSGSLLGVQLGGSFAILAVGVCGSLIPYMLIRCRTSDKALLYLNAASAGILLGAAFIHMVPETTGKLDSLLGDFPLSYFLFCTGLFLMVWLARIGGHPHPHVNPSSHPDCSVCMQPSILHNAQNHGHKETIFPQASEVSITTAATKGSLTTVSSGDALLDGAPCNCEIGQCKECDQNYFLKVDPTCEQHVHCTGADRKLFKCKQLRSVLLLLLGLSVHSFTAGLSLGFTQTVGQAVGIFLAIILHKWCETCAQSLSGIRNGLSMKANAAVTAALSLVTPVGAWIGILIQFASGTVTSPDAFDYISDALIMFVAGTFMQIIFEEILLNYVPAETVHGRDTPCSMSLRVLTMFLGFAFMCCVSVVEGIMGEE